MNASDEPGLQTRSRPRFRVTTSWTRAARRANAEKNANVTAPALSNHARRAARACLHYLSGKTTALDSIPSQVWSVEIAFVDDAQIQELNFAHCGKNKPTDVLSWSQIEGGAFPIAPAETPLGDVVISVETAARQAKELNHSVQEEIAFLTVHGTLHLCGFDHDTSSRRRAMWQHQDAVIERLRPKG